MEAAGTLITAVIGALTALLAVYATKLIPAWVKARSQGADDDIKTQREKVRNRRADWKLVIEQLRNDFNAANARAAHCEELRLEETRRMGRMEEKLEQLQDDLTQLKESLGDAAAQILADEHGTITQVNPAACMLFGYSRPSEMVSKDVSILVPERLREQHQKSMEAAVKRGMEEYRERILNTVALRKNGTEFPVTITLKVQQQAGEFSFGAIIRERRDTVIR